MERILLAANYPDLSQLDIFMMNEKTDIDLFISKIIFSMTSIEVMKINIVQMNYQIFSSTALCQII